jgi:hypothetical protein
VRLWEVPLHSLRSLLPKATAFRMVPAGRDNGRPGSRHTSDGVAGRQDPAARSGLHNARPARGFSRVRDIGTVSSNGSFAILFMATSHRSWERIKIA